MKKDCGFKSKDSFYDRLLSTPNLAVQGEGKPAGLMWGMEESPLIMGSAAIKFKLATNSVTGEVYINFARQICGKPLQQDRGKPH